MNYYSSDYTFIRSTEQTRPKKAGRKIPVNGQPPASKIPTERAQRSAEPQQPQQAPQHIPTGIFPPQSRPAPQEPAQPFQKPVQDAPASTVTRNEALLAEDVQRISTEYSNYRKRVDRDRDTVKENATREAFEKLLPVLDDISAARSYGDLQDGPFAAIANKLDATVRSMGFERINEVDVPFDPNLHEAVVMQPSDTIAADNVLKVLRDGYRAGDKTIRAAQVMVSAG